VNAVEYKNLTIPHGVVCGRRSPETFLFWCPPHWNHMTNKEDPTMRTEYEALRPSSELEPSGDRDPSTNRERPNPFVWVTWLTKLMAGERQCQWASWFRSHYEWDKVPSGCDLARWTADHAELLRARRAILETQGFTVYTEDQNSFTLMGKTGIEVSGKPDIVAIRGQEACVEDCKTGTPRHSDHLQVLVYMLSLPHVEGHCKGRRLEGRIVYKNMVVDVPSSRIDDDLRELFRKTVLTIGGPDRATKVPSWGECRYCDISKADCPERIAVRPGTTSSHGLF